MIETLPRREREVFETLCRLDGATAAGVRAALSDPLSDSAVRTMLTRLEAKGLVSRTPGPDGARFQPVAQPEALARSALRRMVDTFFAGSATSAATALLGLDAKLSPDDIDALKAIIDRAEASGEKG